MTRKTRLLAIGLDAAEPSLMRRWMASGELPVLARLQERAVWGRTTNEPGLYTGAVWPTIFTGVSAGRHGCYYYRQIVNGSYQTAQFLPNDLKHPPFWRAVSDAGRRVAIVDVPKSMLTEGLNGIQVVDWGLHDPTFPSVRCWPPDLADDITRRFGIDPVGQCDAADRTPAQYQDLRARILARIDHKVSLLEHLLQQDRWDLFLAVFGDSHCAGHQFWHLHAREGLQGSASGPGDFLKDVYMALDRAVGRIIDLADADTAVMVFTSHGFGPHNDATAVLDEILRRLEGTPGIHWPNVTHAVRSVYRSFLPVDLRTRLRPLAARVFDSVERIDDLSGAWDRRSRKCFMLPSNDNCGNIRVNLVGREPHGRVGRGAEFEALCDSLAESLLEIVNLETGEPVVTEVLRTADHYNGNHLDDLPDLIVRYNREAPIRRVHSAKIGEVEGQSASCRTGDHRPEGLFFVTRPDLRPGALNDTVRAMDLAPTMAALLGVELPNIDGRPIAAVLHGNESPVAGP